MNRKIAVSTLIILSLFLMPTVLNVNPVTAQSGYTIQKVDHTVEVMFSGHTVVRDEIKVSGSVANGFQIGIPSNYASSVLKVVAFDSNQGYPVEIVNQLGGQSGFYVAQVDFEGQNPQSFTVEFVLSNNLVTEYAAGYYLLDYPAYPSLTTTVSQCAVTLSLPTDPLTTILIEKSDGQVSTTTYTKSSLPAFTSIPASASFDLPVGLLQLVDVTTLNRQLSIAPSGEITCQDKYVLKNLDMSNLVGFLLCLPSDASNVVIRDGAGSILSNQNYGVVGSNLLVNASMPSKFVTGQSAQINAEYTLPSITGDSYTFTLFPAFNYFVDQATFTLIPPEGAVITTSDSSAEITTNGYQQQLTVTRQNVTYVDFEVPNYDFIEVNYSYNPLWASFRPTIIVFGFSIICCIGIVAWKRKPQEGTITRHGKNGKTKSAKTKGQIKAVPANALQTTSELIHRFLDTYEERTELHNELKALDAKVQKGRIPRSQYKNQKRAITARVEGLTRSIEKSKEVFRNSSPEFADLVQELNLAESNLSKAESRLNYLEVQRNNGQITLEEYKETIGEREEAKEAAETAVDGILLRLREKMQ
ncbi:MAG: hypothetical protein ACQCN5_14080 [Candidatus Bathyarchaeia archaeon]|jgi:hypothetical protein